MRKNILHIVLVCLIGLTFLPSTPKENAQASSMSANQPNPRESLRIRLAAGEFDPLVSTEPAGLPDSLRLSAYPEDSAGYYLLQFDGPIANTDIDALAAAGAQVFDYIPDFTFIVKLDQATRAVVEEMSQVRWVGLYQPAYRLEANLLTPQLDTLSISNALQSGKSLQAIELEWDDNPVEVIVTIFRGEALAPIIAQIEDMGGDVQSQSQTKWKSKLRVSILPAQVANLATISGVRWIEAAPEWQLFNNEASDIMGVREIWDTHGLYGDGQTIAVCDTGLDQGSPNASALHDDFEDGSGNSRVAAIHDLVGDGGSDVNSGHGTHVAGSVLGNGAMSGSTPSTHLYPSTAYAGTAPEASLVFQASENNSTGSLVGIPDDLNTLFAQAATSGATLHTNSWGSGMMGMYTSSSEDVDEYVWDHKDFTILFSAGNSGIDSNADGVVDLYSLGSPASAKNCITVGASENDRPGLGAWGEWWPVDFSVAPIFGDDMADNPNGLAPFSSRGPALDGRFKPDIVAPGTFIASTRSSLITGSGWGAINDFYMMMGGTSMSTPLTAGAATIVRQFYTDQQGITPSAALIKGTMTNGAANMSPGQYGSGSTQEIPEERPNNVVGWGRVDLENSIFPALPRTMLYEDETTGLTTGASETFVYTVTASTEPLHVTLAWSDYPGSPVAAGGLVNDLDLTVTGPGGSTYYPNNAQQRGASEHITYDRGGPTGGNIGNPGNRKAVRFTPGSYPATLQTGVFFLASNYSDYPKTFNWYVYDGDGTTGPDNVLASGSTSIRRMGWHVIDMLPENITISNGDFFLAIELPDNDLAWLYDESAPVDGRSWSYDGAWSNWTDNDYMFNAIVTNPAPSTDQDRVNNLLGIDVENPPTGQYTIVVSGYNVPHGPQPYALVTSGAVTRGGGASNTPPTLSGLPDQVMPTNSSADNAIDLWTYAADDESDDDELTFTIDNTPDVNAGISLDNNRYIDINPATGWAGQTDVVIRVTDPGGMSDTDTFSVDVQEMSVWNGGVSSDWHTPNNWTPVGVPTSNDDVVIPDVTNDPVVSNGNAETDDLIIQSGAVLDLTDHVLSVEGALTNDGTIKQTQNVTEGSTTNFLRITNQAGNQTKYYGVEITPASTYSLLDVPSRSPKIPQNLLVSDGVALSAVTNKNLIQGNNLAPADNSSSSGVTVNPSPMAIVNGDFESGSSGWDEYSSNGWTLIVTEFPEGVTPRSGTWAVWLGGDANEIAYIAQNVAIESSSSTLSFWYWIASADVCGYDVAGVLIDSAIVDTFDLCQANNTSGWIERTVDLSAYTGQTVNMQIRVETNGSSNSNLFVDDVTFVSIANPDIEVLPSSLEVTVTQGAIITDLLEINNTGTAALTFEIQEQPIVSWLSVTPVSATLPASDSVSVQAVFDATGLTFGDYSTDLLVNSNDPDENPVTVPALLHVLTGTTNTPPTISGLPDQAMLMNGSANNAIDLWAYADDAESADNELTFTIDNTPDPNAGVQIDNDRYVDIFPATDWTGQTTVTIRVTDIGGLSAIDTFQVTVTDTVNTPPTISDLPDQMLLMNDIANDAIDLWTYADDAESPDNELTFTIDNTPDPDAGISIDGNQYIDINPVTDWTGQTDVIIRVIDPIGMSDTDTFQVTITNTANTTPTISGLPDQMLLMNDSADNAIDLWTHAQDAESPDAQLIFAIDNTPDPDAGVSIDSNHYIDINPVTDWTGQTDVVIRVADPGGLSDTDSFQVSIVSGAITSVTVSVSGNQFCADRTSGVQRCFDIVPNDTLAASVRFYFSEAERNQENLDELLVWRYANSWVEESGPYTCGGTGDAQYVQSPNIANFSLFALGGLDASSNIYLPLVIKGDL